ncbi:MAG TPA: hypothetical protein VF120_02810 [Ktedonobacterales bacterium]
MTSASQSATQDEGHELGLSSLSPEHLARALRAVASELERNPALARRVSEAVYSPAESPERKRHADQGAASPVEEPAKRTSKRTDRTFTPRVVEGVSATLGTGILDPFAVRAATGEAGLRAALADLRLGSLRAIVREHQLDPHGTALHGNDAQRLRALILAASHDAESAAGN